MTDEEKRQLKQCYRSGSTHAAHILRISKHTVSVDITPCMYDYADLILFNSRKNFRGKNLRENGKTLKGSEKMSEEEYPIRKSIQIRLALKFIIRDLGNIDSDLADLFMFAPELIDELSEVGDSIDYIKETLESIQEKFRMKLLHDLASKELGHQLKNNKED